MTDHERWTAVLTRDPRFDGAFVYAVRTTGVFCRPVCPSRRPARANVRFFTGARAAERAGFRPCRRCRPERPGAAPAVGAVTEACRLLDAAEETTPTLATLAAAVGLSPFHLHRTFKRLVGVTPRQYADSRRLARVKARLGAGDAVAGALYEAGYGAASRLYEKAPGQLGMTPGAYRKGGAGVAMAYTVTDCPLGRLLVAATERGVSALYFGDDDATLEAELGREYPAATIRRDDAALGAWLAPVLAHLEGAEPHLDLPTDVRATAFQRQVWEALRRIPYGAIRTYAEVAEAIGRPQASRAVARACATNPVSVIVPCHRVVRADGGLAGYRWGLARKRALLARERAATEEGD